MKRRLVSLFTSVVVALSLVGTLIPQTVSANTYGDIEYKTKTDGTIAITGWYGDDEVNIPSSINGVAVTEIEAYAFDGLNLITAVVIPDTVTCIDWGAFRNCSRLESVVIPDSVTEIKSYSFSNCTKLKSLTLGKSISSIGSQAFGGCSSLESVSIPETVSEMGTGVFEGCSSMKSAEFNAPLETLPSCTFKDCKALESVTLNDSIKTIDDMAFAMCASLATIDLPDTVTAIKNGAFGYCTSLTAIDLPAELTVLERYSFMGCASLANIAIPDAITSIGTGTFDGCTSLKSIEIGDNITEIGSKAFNNCSSLETVTLGSSIRSIYSEAFRGCKALVSVVIPDSCYGIGSYAFADCDLLKNVTIGSKVESISPAAFKNCKALESIVIPDSVEDLSAFVFENCEALKTVTIGEKVEQLEEYTFAGCTSLTSVYIPNSVESIASLAFFYEDSPNVVISFHCDNGVAKGYAQKYGFEYSLVHYGDYEVVNEATCVADGAKTITCTKCGVAETVSIPKDASNHTNIVIDEAVAPSSTTGLTEGSHCGDCGVVIVAQEVVPANNPAPNPAPKPQSNDALVSSFSERLYTTCLNRASDEDGKNYWIDQLKAGKSGADVAKEFFFSKEFKDLNLNNEEYVTRLYETFMDREPDQAGLEYWIGQLSAGKSREFVFDGFVNSAEWANVCLNAGIVSGGSAKPTINKEASAEVTAFATRLYTSCLGRDGEQAGVDYWAGELANMRRSGTQVAYEFFFSKELTDKNISDDDFVNRLYATFMDRAADKDGFDYWMGQLKTSDRKTVFYQFAACKEFGDICASAGIVR